MRCTDIDGRAVFMSQIWHIPSLIAKCRGIVAILQAVGIEICTQLTLQIKVCIWSRLDFRNCIGFTTVDVLMISYFLLTGLIQ